MEQGWDNDVRSFFRKLLQTISMGVLWLLTLFTTGFYFGLAFSYRRPFYAVLIFYIIAGITFLMLLRYFFRVWKKPS